MKHTVTLTLLFVLTTSAAARADGPKLVGEKEIMDVRTKDIVFGGNAGAAAMRLSPDGSKLIYFRKKDYNSQVNGNPQVHEGYKAVLRDLKTGKDTPLPIPAFFDKDYAIAWLSMKVFGLEGKTIVLPEGQDGNKNGFMERSEKSKAAFYNIASGKLTSLAIEGNIILPSFTPDGKTLLVLASVGKDAPEKVTVLTSPVNKIKFRTLQRSGLPRSHCPTSNLMAMVLFTEGANPRPSDFVLYDLKADKVKTKLADQDHSDTFLKNNPQWTADGRYLYYVMVKDEKRNGRRHREMLTHIRDVPSNREVGILSGLAPVGPGPGKASMVLGRREADRGVENQSQILLHLRDKKTPDGKLYPLGDKSMHPISMQGKWLLYTRPGADGNTKLCRAAIVLP